MNNAGGITTDGSGNVYVAGTQQPAQVAMFAKYNSSGVLQWERYMTGTGNQGGRGIVHNGSSVYVVGTSGVGVSSINALLFGVPDGF